MSDDLEDRLRLTLATKAGSVTAGELSRDVPMPAPVLTLRPETSTPRWRRAVLAAAVVAVVGGLGTTVRSRPVDEPVTAGPAEGSTPAPAPSPGTRLRVWPLTNDVPLDAPAEGGALQAPDSAASAYLRDVVGLEDWQVRDLTSQDGTAVADYVLQDVAATVELARDGGGSWYVTGASTELARPRLVGSTGAGVDVSVGPGPRTYDSGVAVRVSAVAADGRVLDALETRARPTGDPVPVALRWSGPELAAVVRADVHDDHDGDPATPDAVIGHWTAAVDVPPVVGLPRGFDSLTADAVFQSSGGPDNVALAYLRDRFPDFPSPGVKLGSARTRAGRAFVSWSVESDIAEGMVLLRRTDDGWAVVAATTRGVDLSDLRVADGHVRGRISSTNENSLFADVLRPDGSPVPGAPSPLGYPGAGYRFGTAAGPGTGTLDVDVPVESDPPIVRVNLVGGTILSVSEVAVPTR